MIPDEVQYAAQPEVRDANVAADLPELLAYPILVVRKYSVGCVAEVVRFAEVRYRALTGPKALPPARLQRVESASTANGTRTRTLRLERAAC